MSKKKKTYTNLVGGSGVAKPKSKARGRTRSGKATKAKARGSARSSR